MAHFDRKGGSVSGLVALRNGRLNNKPGRQTNAICNLVILDDFLLQPITEDDELKILYDIPEDRNEAQKSCVVCSQRDPKAWPAMLMEDEVSSNAILKRVTKHYTVMIEKKSAG